MQKMNIIKILLTNLFLFLTKHKIPLLFFISTFIIYYLTSSGPTPYNYFVHLANAFLQGRLYLINNPPWLNELIPMNGKYYVIYPPMPALLVLPIVVLKGLATNQTLISIFVGGLNAVLVYLLAKRLFSDSDNNRKNVLSLWIATLFIFGTIHWFLASVGSVWYFAHIAATFFLLLAFNETFGKMRFWLIGLLLGAAYWSRLPVILSLPFFLIMIYRRLKTKGEKLSLKNSYFQFFLGLGFFVGLNFIYNYLRFGTIFDVAYYLQANILNEPWYSKGYFNLAYIPNHLKILLLKLPTFLPTFPYIQPSWAGMAIWLTTPAFIFALISTLKHFKDEITIACWSAIIPIAILVMSHGGTGFSQFGYRYAMDFYPFLLILTAKGISLNGLTLRWYHKFLIGISVLINLWGVLWINKFGWVGW